MTDDEINAIWRAVLNKIEKQPLVVRFARDIIAAERARFAKICRDLIVPGLSVGAPNAIAINSALEIVLREIEND